MHPIVIAATGILLWSNPANDPTGPSRTFQLQRQLPGSAWTAATMYSDAAKVGFKTPPGPTIPPGPDSCWVDVPDSPTQPARFRIRLCNGFGCSGWSNHCIIARGERWVAAAVDTGYMIRRNLAGTVWYELPTMSKQGNISWSLAIGDSFSLSIATYEEAVLFHRPRTCELFGEWTLRGQPQPCGISAPLLKP